MAHAANYLRISDDKRKLATGVGRQRADGEAVCAQRWPDLPVVEYKDNDRSAYTGERRPAYEAMCAGIKDGSVVAVAAYDQDRLLRLPRQLEALIDLCDQTGMNQLVTAQGDIDLTTHDGQFRARIMAAVAKKASDDTSRRVKRMQRDHLEAGTWNGGPAPYGYQLGATPGTLELVEPAATHVRTAITDMLRGVSMHAIMQRGHGPQTRYGWRRLVTQPTIAGLTSIHTNASWPALVDLDTWHRTVALFAARAGTVRSKRASWLSGILVCGRCGMALGVANDRYLRCRSTSSCTHIARDAAEAYVEGLLFGAVELVRVRAQPAGVSAAPIVDVDNEMLSVLAVDYAERRITREEWLAARLALTQRASRPVVQTVEAQLEALWPAMTVSERHTQASRLLERIAVSPGRGELSARLSPVWR